MKYYKDDIVEVINLSKYSDQFFRLGWKYHVFCDQGKSNLVRLIDNPERWRAIESYSVMLYKRPFKNTIKYFLESNFLTKYFLRKS